MTRACTTLVWAGAPAGRAIVLLVDDLEVWIVTEDGELLRALVLDPTRDYQRQSA